MRNDFDIVAGVTFGLNDSDDVTVMKCTAVNYTLRKIHRKIIRMGNAGGLTQVVLLQATCLDFKLCIPTSGRQIATGCSD